jgi:putative tricarboxylic transport membrane protein
MGAFDIFAPLIHAVPGVFQFDNFLAIVIGTVAGVVIGALPGISTSIGIAILLPLTFGMQPLVALGMIAGIYNGSMYGGAIPAILLGIPGTPAAICTVFDGYPMAKQGRATEALKVACYASAIGGLTSSLSLIVLAPPLAAVTLLFGPSEIFWVAILGLASVAVLLGDDIIKGLLSACVGLLISTVGVEHITGVERFTFDELELFSGFDLVAILVGLYALPRVLMMAEEAIQAGVDNVAEQIRNEKLGFLGVLKFWKTLTRGSIIGIIIGILPGAGGSVAAFMGYNEVKRTSPDPESFGKGNPHGVAASECANNAEHGGALIPALTLGVPGNAVCALILGGLLVHGLQPGPALFRDNPDIVFGFMIQMVLTSIFIFFFGGVIANRLFAQLLRLPQVILAPMIVTLMAVGIYSINNSFFDLYVLLGFGLAGYFMEKLHFPLAPAVLGLVLGEMAEANLHISLSVAHGDWTFLFSRGLSQVIIVLVAATVLYPIYQWYKARRTHQARTVFD